MYYIEYLPSAQRELVSISRYISHELCNPDAANRLAENIIDSIDTLCRFPYAHPVYIPIRPLPYEYRKFPVQNYMIFYRVDEENKKVIIAHIIYGKRNSDALLK